MKVLVTGFEPFGNDSINPALEIIKALPKKNDDIDLVGVEIPTVFGKSLKSLEEYIEAHRPDIVICLGLAGGRKKISIERVAINIDDARMDDNSGNRPIDEKIYADGENAYFSNLPIKRMAKAIRDVNIPVEISNSAGTFVCNHLMYGLMYLIDKKYPEIRGTFIHLPFLPEQVLDRNAPSMSLEDMKVALLEAIKVGAKYEDDIKELGGKIH